MLQGKNFFFEKVIWTRSAVEHLIVCSFNSFKKSDFLGTIFYTQLSCLGCFIILHNKSAPQQELVLESSWHLTYVYWLQICGQSDACEGRGGWQLWERRFCDYATNVFASILPLKTGLCVLCSVFANYFIWD